MTFLPLRGLHAGRRGRAGDLDRLDVSVKSSIVFSWLLMIVGAAAELVERRAQRCCRGRSCRCRRRCRELASLASRLSVVATCPAAGEAAAARGCSSGSASSRRARLLDRAPPRMTRARPHDAEPTRQRARGAAAEIEALPALPAAGRLARAGRAREARRVRAARSTGGGRSPGFGDPRGADRDPRPRARRARRATAPGACSPATAPATSCSRRCGAPGSPASRSRARATTACALRGRLDHRGGALRAAGEPPDAGRARQLPAVRAPRARAAAPTCG